MGIDFTKDIRFAQLSCVAVVGDIEISDRIQYAATNGRDEVYNPDFVMAQNRKQMRYVRAHELLHKQLKHCHAYRDVSKKYPYETNVSMDIVINLMILPFCFGFLPLWWENSLKLHRIYSGNRSLHRNGRCRDG